MQKDNLKDYLKIYTFSFFLNQWWTSCLFFRISKMSVFEPKKPKKEVSQLKRGPGNDDSPHIF